MTPQTDKVSISGTEQQLIRVLDDDCAPKTTLHIADRWSLRRADTDSPLYQIVVDGEVASTVAAYRIKSTTQLLRSCQKVVDDLDDRDQEHAVDLSGGE